ncbi:hypothetical protein SAMN05880501_1128 [Ureibacillus xyleni]|uniref:Uncharacterized protein n=1 Tax=Ureibacillus xyleni TaxID=614648 RepID=A0A285TEN3_9BACL|nr:hypothetical protein SAMN05880501_1128 [Ureibacillus xyleni]
MLLLMGGSVAITAILGILIYFGANSESANH